MELQHKQQLVLRSSAHSSEPADVLLISCQVILLDFFVNCGCESLQQLCQPSRAVKDVLSILRILLHLAAQLILVGFITSPATRGTKPALTVVIERGTSF